MKKYAVVLVLGVLFIFASLVSVFSNDIIWDDIGRGNLNLRTVMVHPENPKIIYVGSSNGVLKSEDSGANWRTILSIRGQNKVVNFLLFDPQDKNSLYAATGNGVFYSNNQGKNWSRVFKGKDYLENECTTLTILPYGIYLGTRQGIFLSRDKGRSWHKETGKLGNSNILAIASDIKEPDYIYAACIEGVFKTQNKGKDWENIFVISPPENNNGDEEEELEDQDEKSRVSEIRYITIDAKNLNHLYLATSRGVYKSQDRGKSWEPLTSFGLLNRDVNFILISPQSNLYAATKSGIFEYINNRWQELSLGLTANDIRFLALDKQHNLYVACDRGLFKAKIEYLAKGNDGQDNTISLYYKNEPTIKEVQQIAIKYAEVEPEKIIKWRKQAKIKALLPKLTVGLDRSESTNYEIYTSQTTRYVYEGPDDKSNGWDVTLSWELGDLIWSDNQTSIDVRSRLMVQLRDDILDEVTKIYFERLRIKMELDNLSIEDRKRRLEKELRLHELTAMLDALTGGYFSQQLKPDKNRS